MLKYLPLSECTLHLAAERNLFFLGFVTAPDDLHPILYLNPTPIWVKAAGWMNRSTYFKNF